MSRVLGVLLAALLGLACGAPRSAPESAVRQVYGSLWAYGLQGDPEYLRQAYEALDDPTRARLDEQATAASARLGAKVAPWELLTYRGLGAGDRISGYEVVEQTESAARVRVKFAWFVPPEAGGRDLQPEPAVVDVVRRGEAWRVALPLGM